MKSICITFPRSGHHLFQRLLQMNCPEIVYCDLYNHCKIIPCIDPFTNFQKSHDFNLNDPFLSGYLYFVQYRNPYESISSWYDLHINMSKNKRQCTQEYWKEFLEAKIEFWNDFMRKWTIEFPTEYGKERFMNIQYNDLIENTNAVICASLEFLGYHIDKKKVKTHDTSVAFNEYGRIITTVPKKQRHIEDFKYFDLADVELVKKRCSQYTELIHEL